MLHKRPNIVLFIADSLRARSVSCYGYEKQTTPNLDRFAASGVKFDNCFVQAPFTVASSASLLTGTYASVHRLERYGQRLPDSLVTFPELLRESGYATAAFVANPHVNHDSGLTRGFDYFTDGRPSWKSARIASRLVAWAESGRTINRELSAFLKGQSAQPLFLLVFYNDSHVPFSSYPRMLLPLVGGKYHTPDFDRHEYNDREIQRVIELYDEAVGRVDARIGEAVEILGSRLSIENTLFVVSADHGEGLDRRANRGGHGRLYESGIHVPLIAFGAGVQSPDRTVSDLVQSIDLSATFLDVAGVTIDRQFEGLSLAPALRAEVLEGPTSVLSEYHDSRSIRSSDWKLIVRGLDLSSDLLDHDKDSLATELYYLKSDPDEAINLADADSASATLIDLQVEMQKIYARLEMDAKGDPESFDFDRLVVERLRGLGYLE